MSSQYINQVKPQHQINARLNNLVLDNDASLKKVTYSPLPNLYTQITSAGTAVSITNAEECFDVQTVSLTTSSGALEAFTINHTGVGANDMIQLTQVSYSGAYNVNGALMAHIAAVSAGTFTVGIRNWGSGSANGPIKLRFKIYHNSA